MSTNICLPEIDPIRGNQDHISSSNMVRCDPCTIVRGGSVIWPTTERSAEADGRARIRETWTVHPRRHVFAVHVRFRVLHRLGRRPQLGGGRVASEPPGGRVRATRFAHGKGCYAQHTHMVISAQSVVIGYTNPHVRGVGGWVKATGLRIVD